MKKPLFYILLAGVLLALVAVFFRTKQPQGLKVGVVLPIAHNALDEIVNGFKQELYKNFSSDEITVEVQNALGDINLQKSAINKFVNDHVDLLVPITTGTSQMAINLAPETIKLLFLAAEIPGILELALEKPNITGVNDEISIPLRAQFIHNVMPDLRKIAVVFSASDKNFDEVDAFIKAMAPFDVKIQKLMVQTLSDLYTVSKRIDQDVGAIFILKDSTVASGINTLVAQADHLRIPLISSDQATNESGGAFALGVIESDIGRQGASMAISLLKDQRMPEERIQNIKRYLVFINDAACQRQNIEKSTILQAASKMQLEVFKE